MQTEASEMFNSSASRLSDALVRQVFNDGGLPGTVQEKPKAPIGVATMDARGILVMELRLTAAPRQTPPVHYCPGMPDYNSVVQHIGINPGQTKFVYPFP